MMANMRKPKKEPQVMKVEKETVIVDENTPGVKITKKEGVRVRYIAADGKYGWRTE